MDIGDMDPEDFQLAYRQARKEWERLNLRRLEIEGAGQQLNGEERDTWLAAKRRYEEFEQFWDQAYNKGVTIVIGDDDEDKLS